MSEGVSLRADAELRYVGAQERAGLALERWVELDRPFVIVHANRVQGVHPVYKALVDAERHADLMRRALLGRDRWFLPHIGPEGEDLADLSPAARLRSIPKPVATPVRERRPAGLRGQTRDGAA